MPNGYRRGGTYRRNGKTFSRRGTKIKQPVALYAFAGAAVFGTWAIGAPLAASPVALGLVVTLGVGVFVSKRLSRWVKKRAKVRTSRTVQDPHNTGLGVSVTTWGKG